MDQWNMMVLELCAQSLAAGREQQRCDPEPPSAPGFWTVRRRRLAQRLIALGLRLDADASRAVLGCATAPQLKGRDA